MLILLKIYGGDDDVDCHIPRDIDQGVVIGAYGMMGDKLSSERSNGPSNMALHNLTLSCGGMSLCRTSSS